MTGREYEVAIAEIADAYCEAKRDQTMVRTAQGWTFETQRAQFHLVPNRYNDASQAWVLSFRIKPLQQEISQGFFEEQEKKMCIRDSLYSDGAILWCIVITVCIAIWLVTKGSLFHLITGANGQRELGFDGIKKLSRVVKKMCIRDSPEYVL